MPIPPLNEHGDLPTGLHQASLSEVLDRFGSDSSQRVLMAQRIERVNRLTRETKHMARFVIFDSFITNKPDPNDVDIFMIMSDIFDVSLFTGESILVFEHTSAQDYFGTSVF